MKIECPMCGPDCCGGAHYNALMEEGIHTKEQWETLKDKTKLPYKNGLDGKYLHHIG